ncbi:Na/Pi cotransporter [Paenibacillus sp. FSL R5-0490]|uniref:Na/Pi symporter n=1 Tax=Bacillales TaxID=1385 RepID=UPI00096F1A73|nr:Na/Pi symporter [Paenibacillus sp. FSL R5-0490]OMF61875.1 Na/Pi cotransporter [Paenibacillus sp. FSL R5-0490]
MVQLLLFFLLIALFIYGMTLLRSGLFNLSAGSLKNWLAAVTNSPWKGTVMGTIVTAVLQSSSAVMIITIGMVSARMLTFPQTIGIILGTNIGTTFTTELITFNIESYIVPLAAAGSILAVMKNKSLRSSGLAVLGLSAVFAAMRGFEYLAGSVKDNDMVNHWLLTLDGNYLFAVAAGIVLTAIIQSSTATTGIIMGFLTAGAMDLDTGIAIMLGSNIGTCVDAYLASIGSGKEAKLTAFAHIWLNCLGVAAFYPFIHVLAVLGESAASSPDVQLAHISVLFNVLSSLLVLPFANQFGRFVIRLHGR